MSLVNLVIVMACLIKLLVYGEPIVDRKKCDASNRWRTIAEEHFENGDTASAATSYLRLLHQFGVYLPASNSMTWFECVSFTTWQVARAIFHRLPFGLWLSRKVGGLFCSQQTRVQALSSYREIGWVLHRLNQIDLMEKHIVSTNESTLRQIRQSIYGLMVSLYAVNMCEIAESVMSTREMTEMYLMAALRMNATNRLRVLGGYYLRKAKSHHLLNTSPHQQFDWIFNEHGQQFVANAFSQPTASTLSHEPIGHVQQKYCEHLLEQALETLLGFRHASPYTAKRNSTIDDFTHTEIAIVLSYAKQLMECVECDHSAVTDAIIWLANIVAVAAHWRLYDIDISKTMYERTDRFPRSLVGSKSNEKTLFKALFVVFVARRELVHHQYNNTITLDSLQFITNRCNVASSLLHDHVMCSRATPSNNNNHQQNSVLQFVRLLASDWLLETRTECWEWAIDAIENGERDEGISEPTYWVTASELKQYQHDLNSMQLIAEQCRPMDQSRLHLYEAIYRLMAGAAPLETHTLLQRNMQPTRHSRSNLICGGKATGDDGYICGERERALSIYVACRFLPAQVSVERAGLLTQASAIFKQIGDIKSMNRCYRLLNYANNAELVGRRSKSE